MLCQEQMLHLAVFVKGIHLKIAIQSPRTQRKLPKLALAMLAQVKQREAAAVKAPQSAEIMLAVLFASCFSSK